MNTFEYIIIKTTSVISLPLIIYFTLGNEIKQGLETMLNFGLK
jgi:hypothetical protein